MKIVFLDIDGVLNSVAWQKRRGPKETGVVVPSPVVWERMIDPEAVTLLNGLLERTEAKVVISSTWRTMMPVAEIKRTLGSKGFTGEIIDQTPDLRGGFRHHEIGRWLQDHAPLGPWVALDDDRMPALGNRLVRTDYLVGLTEADVEKAVTLLSGWEGAAS